MASGITEMLIELATLLAYTLLSGVLTYAGILSEQTAIDLFTTGVTPLSVWFLVLGAIALYGGVVAVGRDLVVTRLLSLLH